LLFLLKDGSTVSLAIQDLTDVGVSDALHTGLGFFGLLHAASACRGRRKRHCAGTSDTVSS
jgi:hypothetical protein